MLTNKSFLGFSKLVFTSALCNIHNLGWNVNDTDISEISKLILKLTEIWNNLSNEEKVSDYPFGMFENTIDWNSQAQKLVDGKGLERVGHALISLCGNQ